MILVNSPGIKTHGHAACMIPGLQLVTHCGKGLLRAILWYNSTNVSSDDPANKPIKKWPDITIIKHISIEYFGVFTFNG
jgi:hypothetical protein